jgi:hypothetical protein
MSALGQKQTFKRLRLMSALPPKADIRQGNRDVRFVRIADSRAAAKYVAIRPPRPDQNDCNCRNRCSNSVAGEAWYRGMEAAMRVRLGRKPVHDE